MMKIMTRRERWVWRATLAGVAGILVLLVWQNVTTRRIASIAQAISSSDSIIPNESSFCEAPHRAICRRGGPFTDPTGTVRRDVSGEVKALRMYEEIVRGNPDWDREQWDEALVRKIYTAERVKRVRMAESFVRKTIKRWIQKQPVRIFSKAEKRLLLTRLDTVVVELPIPASVYGDARELFTKSDVFYERDADGHLRLRIGGAYLLAAKSYFNLVFTLAHELAHSIDPCEVLYLGEEVRYYKRLVACFIHSGWVESRKDRVECRTRDQSAEVFADWLAVQVTHAVLQTLTKNYDQTALLGAVANSVRDLCQQEESWEELDLDWHPSPEVRIRSIFLGHPGIRRLIQCKKVYPAKGYCGMDSIG